MYAVCIPGIKQEPLILVCAYNTYLISIHLISFMIYILIHLSRDFVVYIPIYTIMVYKWFIAFLINLFCVYTVKQPIFNRYNLRNIFLVILFQKLFRQMTYLTIQNKTDLNKGIVFIEIQGIDLMYICIQCLVFTNRMFYNRCQQFRGNSIERCLLNRNEKGFQII